MSKNPEVNPLPRLTLPQMLREQAKQHPGRIAIRQKDFGIWQGITWDDYYRRSSHVGLGLRALGLSAGGHVGVLAENRIEWVLTQMGCGLVGGIAVGVYPTSPAPEVAYVLNHADVEVVVCEDQEQTDKVVEALDQLPHLRAIVVMETKGLRNADERVRDRILSFADLETLGVEYEATHRHLVEETLAAQQLEDIALMIYTSGSTGKPKGAMISYANIRGVAPGIADRLGLSADTSHLSYLPLCHVAEQMLTTFCPIYLGSTVAFGESIRTVQEDLREIAPTMFLGVPRIWEKLHSAISIKMQESGPLQRWLFDRAMAACAPFAHKAAAQRTAGERLTYAVWYWIILRALQNFIGLRRAKVALTGAAPIPPAVVQFFRTLGVPLVEVYGLTESTGMITGQAARCRPLRLGRHTHPRCRAPDRRARRAADPGRDGVRRLLQEPGGDRRQHPRRLAAHRRRGRGARRPALHRRSPEGHHDHRRRQEPDAVRDREDDEGQPLHQGSASSSPTGASSFPR
ncbi:AMP-dependent synthetase/ligase [Thauera humireducens]|uniref:AMP-dependent synthetase/ligase n=1 Tax=Thauera humireducens TaxID=1134435 RepID=UPI00311F8AAB